MNRSFDVIRAIPIKIMGSRRQLIRIVFGIELKVPYQPESAAINPYENFFRRNRGSPMKTNFPVQGPGGHGEFENAGGGSPSRRRG